MRFLVRTIALIVCLVRVAMAANPVKEEFSTDPKWDALNNRQLPANLPVTRQHFGWRNTQHAGGTTKGEIGGRIQRSATLASYAMPKPPKSRFKQRSRGTSFCRPCIRTTRRRP